MCLGFNKQILKCKISLELLLGTSESARRAANGHIMYIWYIQYLCMYRYTKIII